MPYFLAGKPLAKGQSFSAGDTLFPSNFLDLSTEEERSSLGIKEESESPSTDPSEIRFGGSPFEENDSLRSEEENQSPSTIPSETRLAGGNFETSVPTITESPTQESNVLTDNDFPDLDATTKSYIEALGQDFFKENIAPQLAGSRFFGTDKGEVTYRKPSNLKGGVLSYNRQDKIQPQAPAYQPPTYQPPTYQPPTYQPPTYQPPTYQPPTYEPPTYQPPTDKEPIIGSPSIIDPEKEKPKLTTTPTTPPTTTPTKTPTPTTTPTKTTTTPKQTNVTLPNLGKTPQTLAMTRFFKPGNSSHFYTSNRDEGISHQYPEDGFSFNLFADLNEAEGATDIYRLYNPTTGKHFFTASKQEADTGVSTGSNMEGVVGEAYTSERPGTTAVQRYFNAAKGVHLLTSSAEEEETLPGLGYRKEGVAFYTPNQTFNTANKVDQAYEKYLGVVEPDKEGFDYWMNEITSGKATLDDTLKAIGMHPTAQGYLKSQQTSPNTDLSEIRFGGSPFEENDSLREKEESQSPSSTPTQASPAQIYQQYVSQQTPTYTSETSIKESARAEGQRILDLYGPRR